MELYDHQKDAISKLIGGKKFVICGTGMGKTSMMLYWLKSTGKKKCLIITSAAKAHAHDIEPEADAWFGSGWRKSLSSFSVISWAIARGTRTQPNWFVQHAKELDDCTIAFDEVHSAKAGISSAQGKVFLQITAHTDFWTGYTATPSTKWIDKYPYFTACKHVRNKTEFLKRFAIVETFRGFPDYVGWNDVSTMEDWWADDSYAPNDKTVKASLPPEKHIGQHFKKPSGYDKVDRTGYDLDGNFIETNSGLRHYLRRMCASKEKMEWIRDFVDGLQTSCVIFYNYVSEGDMLEATIKKDKTVGKIWRIGGGKHDIPTAQTIYQKDVVLCQWQSGSASLNLQFIDYWVSCTPCDGYIMYVQAKGRIQRIGAKNPKFFYYLKCDGTEEDNIYKNLKERKDFADKEWVIKRKEDGKYLPEG